jgi:hypothetical protein
MSNNRSFHDLIVPPDSPLVRYLGIKPGNYSGELDDRQGELLLKRRGGNQEYSMRITPAQLMVTLMMLDRDKFTSEEVAMIEKIKRSSSFSGTKVSPAHHIIPFAVCKNSKLVVQAINFEIFDIDGDINRLPLPAYFHNEGGHKNYSSFVAQILKEEWDMLVDDRQENDKVAVKYILESAIDYFREKIQERLSSGDGSIEQVFLRWD